MMWFWVIVLVAIIGAIAILASGKGDTMRQVFDDRPDTAIAIGRPLTVDDLADVTFSTGLRGYRMDEVDALIDRVRADLLERENAQARIQTEPVDTGPVDTGPVAAGPMEGHLAAPAPVANDSTSEAESPRQFER